MARIFLVEDNESIREAVAGYLKLEDHEVIEFGGVADMLPAMRHRAPDLAILDVMLPDGSGFALAKKIRAESPVPLIFLTARETESDRITGFELGADDYVVKPFSPKELVLQVQALLRRSGAADGPKGADGCWERGSAKLCLDGATVAQECHRACRRRTTTCGTPRHSSARRIRQVVQPSPGPHPSPPPYLSSLGEHVGAIVIAISLSLLIAASGRRHYTVGMKKGTRRVVKEGSHSDWSATLYPYEKRVRDLFFSCVEKMKAMVPETFRNLDFNNAMVELREDTVHVIAEAYRTTKLKLIHEIDSDLIDSSGYTESNKILPYRERCQVCGEVRGANKCHIIPREDGGDWREDNAIYLCPTHHFLFDQSILSAEEFSKISVENKRGSAAKYFNDVRRARQEMYWKYGAHKWVGCECRPNEYHYKVAERAKEYQIFLECGDCGELYKPWDMNHPLGQANASLHSREMLEDFLRKYVTALSEKEGEMMNDYHEEETDRFAARSDGGSQFEIIEYTMGLKSGSSGESIPLGKRYCTAAGDRVNKRSATEYEVLTFDPRISSEIMIVHRV